MYQYKFDKENCWYKTVCNKFNTENCNSNCIRYMEMHYLMESANIPKSNQFKNELIPNKVDLQAFTFLKKIKDDIVNFVNNGENLYIFSNTTGNGKTTWAIKLIQKYFNEIWAGNGFKVRGLFIYVPTFLIKLKNVTNKDEEFETFKKLITEVDLVIWDDIATNKLTEFDSLNLSSYIEERRLAGKSNIYTGNLDGEQLKDYLGQRLKTRIFDDSTTVQLFGNDRRGGNN